MTEAEWLAATDPAMLTKHMRGKASDRKFRLFAVACCRLNADPDSTDLFRHGLELIERFADGAATDRELESVWRDAILFDTDERRQLAEGPASPEASRISLDRRQAYLISAAAKPPDGLISHLGTKTGGIKGSFIGGIPYPEWQFSAVWTVRVGLDESESVALLRDLFGDPFRPFTPEPRWLTADVRGLAHSIYDDRAFDRLPILADALLDAGCDNEDILSHCRSPGPHVRGCWVVDLLTGRE
jgi:hypothetical protein